jgi:transposase-like protein
VTVEFWHDTHLIRPRHKFPPDVTRHAVWLYLRFTPSYRDVEELMAERGLDVSPKWSDAGF